MIPVPVTIRPLRMETVTLVMKTATLRKKMVPGRKK